jgi:hypothetical protein
MTYRKYIVLFFVCIFFACSCGGRAANPVTIKRDQDQRLTCPQIEYEIYQIRNDITELYSQTTKSIKKKSVVSVLAAINPLLYVLSDLRKAEKIEINALEKRHNHIVMIAKKKGCGEGKFLLSTETKCKDFYTIGCFMPSKKK